MRANHAELLEQCVVHAVGAGERTRMRHRGARAALRSADLEGDHRLAGTGALQRRTAERLGIAHAFDVEGHQQSFRFEDYKRHFHIFKYG